MSIRLCAHVAFCLLVPSMAGRAQQPAPAPPPVPLIDAEHLIMQPEQAATGARVMGDGSKPGFYVTRTRFAAWRGSKPHYHDQDRYVTVIKGTWWTGKGDVYKPETMVPIKAGGSVPPGRLSPLRRGAGRRRDGTDHGRRAGEDGFDRSGRKGRTGKAIVSSFLDVLRVRT